jgi:hypothetical protein
MFMNPSGLHHRRDRHIPRKTLASCCALALGTALALAGAASAGAATQPYPVKPSLFHLVRHLPSAKAAAIQPTATTKAQWRTDIRHVRQPGTGCYRASYPVVAWHATRCVTAPRVPLAPGPVPRPARHAGPDQVGGNGIDYSAQVSGLISQATGTFADVSSGITEQGYVDGVGSSTANAFTLQLNSQFFTGSPACDGSSDPSDCLAWQQFVYAYEGCSVSCIFMQYWLINYDATCPAGWTPYDDDCYTNSSLAEVSGLTASELATVQLTGSAASGGNDAVSLLTGSGSATSVTNSDSEVDLASFWNTTEWGVYGDGSGSEAIFGSGTTLQAQTALTSNSTAAPTCAEEDFTGESNNLNLTSTPALGSQTWPTMASTQTNGATGTASCATASGSPPYQVAYQGSNAALWLAGTGGTADTGDAMMTGTSPSITALTGGGYEVAYQASTGVLWTTGTSGSTDWGVPVMAGTSPAITAVPGGVEIAYQDPSGNLETVGNDGDDDWDLGMMYGTSPAITAVSGGFEAAFQANTGDLWTVGNAGDDDWGVGMNTGTSPSITAVPGGFEAAFQYTNGNLWTVGNDGNDEGDLGMMYGTSPSIAAVPGGFEIAFQANTGVLWTVGNAGNDDWGLGMMSGTNPALTAISGGFEAAFQANTGDLWTVGNAGDNDWELPEQSSTSPAITSLS